MPGKEAVVEVETNGVVPEPVTKEIQKCGASLEVKGKKDEDPEPVKTTDTASVPDSADSKPQDTEITSSVEQKADKEDSSSDTKNTAESSNGSTERSEEKAKVSEVDEGTKADESADSKVEATEELKSSEATPKAESVEAKGSEAEAKPAESTVDAKSAEAEVAESKADPMDTDAKGGEASTIEKVEAMDQDAKSSEAAAKPLPADDEKIIVEKDSESNSANPVVTGSDEVEKPEAVRDSDTNENGSSSADSSTEKKPENPSSSETKTDEKPGSSSSTKVEPDLETQISELKKKGLALYVRKDFCAAADTFGKVLEVAAPLYGEMSEKLAETYFLYGSAMYEYGKAENEVLGEKVKEKDDEDKEEEGSEGEEQMEVDDKEAKPATEESAEKRATTPSGYGETEEAEDDGKEPADETITGDAKDEDDDSFRVAWEMLELAKATFLKADNKKRLADTLIKLGEVGIETDNATAIDEMVEGLKIRREVYPETHRIIPETHFTIGIAYAAFDKYDEAIEQFTNAKDCLEKRIEELSKSDKQEDKAEVEEMKSLLPEIQEKIEDTKESKADKEKMKKKLEGELLKEAPFPAPSEDKPVSNITHLVKRKRKVDDILLERAAKQSRQGDPDVASTTAEETEGSENPAKPADSMEIAECEQKEEPKVVENITESREETKPDTKSEEKLETKPEQKGEENPEVKDAPKPEVKDAPKPEVKDAAKPEERASAESEKPAEPAKPEEPAKSEAPEKMEE